PFWFSLNTWRSRLISIAGYTLVALLVHNVMPRGLLILSRASPGRITLRPDARGSELSDGDNTKPRTLATIPARVETPILTITIRRKALTVFGLTAMRLAMSLLLSPRRRNVTATRSRCVRRNC